MLELGHRRLIRIAIGSTVAITATLGAWWLFDGKIEPWQALTAGYLVSLAERHWPWP